ncbi:MAG: SAM-dependent methyltransferase, partial [Chloroflexi bacterium]|nr:SAM-dependent methyltransferase [Chloroflexota bacterium]
MSTKSFIDVLKKAIAARAELFDEKHRSAFRLLNGFLEGSPDVAIDLYARTVVIHNYADPPSAGEAAVRAAGEFLLEEFPWLKTVVVKTRKGVDAAARNGILLHGGKPDDRIREHGV